MKTKLIHDILHSIKLTKFEDIPQYFTTWNENSDITPLIDKLHQNEIDVTIVELIQLFTVYYHRNNSIEIFAQIECFDNLFLSSQICIEAFDNYLNDANDENFGIFTFYFNNYLKLYKDWKRIVLVKNVLPSLLQYHLFMTNNDTENAKSMLITIKNIYPDYKTVYELLVNHFSKINKQDLLIIQVCEYFIEYGFIDLYKQIQEGNMKDVIFYMKTVKDYLYDLNNIDVDFFVENLQKKTLSNVYINQLTQYIVREFNTKVLSFYYDLTKLLYFKNEAVDKEIFVLFFLSIVIKILTKNIELS
jgi:hypothetical protein